MKAKPILMSGPMSRATLAGTKTQTRRCVKLKGCQDLSWVKSIHQDGGGNWIAWSNDTSEHAEFTKRAYPNGEGFKSPYQVGDRLWVRETWAYFGGDEYLYQRDRANVMYRATADTDHRIMVSCGRPLGDRKGWRPSIFMPRWASRITLEVTEVRCERLQNISGTDLAAEGFSPDWDAFEEATAGMEGWEQPEEFIPECEEQFDYINFGNRLVVSSMWREWDRDRRRMATLLPFKALWQKLNGKKHPWETNPWVWAYTFRRVPNA